MAWTAKFLFPIRQSISRSRQQFRGNFGPLRRWTDNIEHTPKNRASVFENKLNLRRNYVQHFLLSGSRNTRSIFGASIVLGAVYCLLHCTHAMEGFDVLEDEFHMESFDGLERDDDQYKLWVLMRKLWLSVFLVYFVLVNWDNPLAVATKVLVFLLSTKPDPLSIYLVVERLRQRYMHQKPFFYRFKRLYAIKVEVQDYKFLCLAKVEIEGQKFPLIGILGSWWSLPLSLAINFFPEQCCSA